jgi:hypothetical protein
MEAIDYSVQTFITNLKRGFDVSHLTINNIENILFRHRERIYLEDLTSLAVSHLMVIAVG